ncbi:lipopolysaccharide-induced tumor necrosis factor-alpha factor [Lates japonicus]
MENPDQDVVLLQSFTRRQTATSYTCDSSEPQQEQHDESEPEFNQEAPQQKKDATPLTLIKFRIQQLQNRRFLLLRMQHFKKRAENDSVTCEDSDDMCELEAIQKELEELLVKKEELENKGMSANLRANGGQEDAQPTFYKSETPLGGIYTLPPPQQTQEDVTPEQSVKTTPAAETPTDMITPVDSLGPMPVTTRCPHCQEVIVTETYRKVGESMFLLCCLCSMMGCVAGCCLFPFFIERLKSVHHDCPHCKAHIYTYQPF